MENLLVFDSTHQAIALELVVKNQKINARLIPIPEAITAGCGLALKFQETDFIQVKQLALAEGMTEATFYQIRLTANSKEFKKIDLALSERRKSDE